MSKTTVWAIMALGILLLLASFVGLFFLFPLAIILLLIGVLLGLKPGGILRTEQVMDSWSVLIENGQGKEDEVETDLTKSHRGYTDLIAEKGSEVLRIEIEHRSSKGQIEKNIRKNLEYSDVVYEIASDETAKKKAIQVALKVMFRLRKEKPDKNLKVKMASIDELKQSGFREWFEVRI